MARAGELSHNGAMYRKCDKPPLRHQKRRRLTGELVGGVSAGQQRGAVFEAHHGAPRFGVSLTVVGGCS